MDDFAMVPAADEIMPLLREWRDARPEILVTLRGVLRRGQHRDRRGRQQVVRRPLRLPRRDLPRACHGAGEWVAEHSGDPVTGEPDCDVKCVTTVYPSGLLETVTKETVWRLTHFELPSHEGSIYELVLEPAPRRDP